MHDLLEGEIDHGCPEVVGPSLWFCENSTFSYARHGMESELLRHIFVREKHIVTTNSTTQIPHVCSKSIALNAPRGTASVWIAGIKFDVCRSNCLGLDSCAIALWRSGVLIYNDLVQMRSLMVRPFGVLCRPIQGWCQLSVELYLISPLAEIPSHYLHGAHSDTKWDTVSSVPAN